MAKRTERNQVKSNFNLNIIKNPYRNLIKFHIGKSSYTNDKRELFSFTEIFKGD